MKKMWIPITGLSMSPFLRCGDKVLIETTDSEDCRPGEVVLFFDQSTKELTVHRLLQHPFVTKGDFSCSIDTSSSESQLGRVLGYERNNLFRLMPEPGSFTGRYFLMFSRMRLHGLIIRKLALIGLIVLTKIFEYGSDKTSSDHTEMLQTADL